MYVCMYVCMIDVCMYVSMYVCIYTVIYYLLFIIYYMYTCTHATNSRLGFAAHGPLGSTGHAVWLELDFAKAGVKLHQVPSWCYS